MGHVQDRWYRPKIDEDGNPVLNAKGKPVKEKTELYGRGMRYKVRYLDPAGAERSKMYPDRQLGAAQEFLNEMENQKIKGTYLDPEAGKISFEEFAKSWLDARTFDESSREGVEWRLKLHVNPYFGNREIRSIRPSDIQAWDRKLQRKGLAETYRRVIFANVSSIFTAAIDDERLRKNPCNAPSVTKPRGEYPKIVPWTEKRTKEVREALGERYRVMVNLGAGCGLRQGEVFGLSPDDIDEDYDVIQVVRQIKIVRGKMVFGPPKHGKSRDVPLPASVSEALNAHRQAFPPLSMTLPWQEPGGDPVTVDLLLYTRESGPLHRHSFNSKVWKPALRKAGIENPGRREGFHALRHFYASVLLDAGESIRALADYLGHADPGFTLRTYTHLMPSSAERTRKAIDLVLGRVA